MLAKLAAKSGAVDPRLVEEWPHIVGRKTANMCWPTLLWKQGNELRLQLSTPNGSTAMFVQYQTTPIIQCVNRYLISPQVSRISIKQTGGVVAERWKSRKFKFEDLEKLAAEPGAEAYEPAESLEEALSRMEKLLHAEPDQDWNT